MSTGDIESQEVPRRDSQALVQKAIWLIGVVLILYFLVPMASPWLDDKAKTLTAPGNVKSESTAEVAPVDLIEEPEPASILEEKWGQAVAFARLADLTAKSDMARERVQRLSQLEANWKARLATVLHGDPGRRIAGSQAHVALALEVFDHERPSPHQIRLWERQAEALRTPIESASLETSRNVLITSDYIKQLTDLGRDLTDAVSVLEEQALLLSTLLQETKALEPGERTLEQALEELRAQKKLEMAERVLATRLEVRARTEQRQLARIAQHEEELVTAEGERQAAAILREKARIEQLARDEADKAAEEDRVHEARKLAELALLKSEAQQIEEQRRLAQLEIEFERDRPLIESYLVAFTTPGYGHRKDGTKGPVSLGFLEATNCLQETAFGMSQLSHYAHAAANDRPAGSLPQGNMTIHRPAFERAQQLLIKYGELMVAKGMLAP